MTTKSTQVESLRSIFAACDAEEPRKRATILQRPREFETNRIARILEELWPLQRREET